MEFRYFKNNAPLHVFVASEMDAAEAQQWHEDRRPYTVGLFENDQVTWRLSIGPGRNAHSCYFYDELKREEVSYGWNDQSSIDQRLPEGTLLLSRAFGWMYRDDEPECCRKASIYFKQDGRLWRRYFNHDTQQSEDIVEEGGAKKYPITQPAPEFGNYEPFLTAEIEPVFSWMDDWPVNVA